MNQIHLPENVQFVYEHALAKLEMRLGFDVSSLVTDESNPWLMNGEIDGQTQLLLERCAYGASVDGRESIYAQLIKPAYKGGRFNLIRSENQYLTHWIYPYKGKFHPRMIRAILNIVGARPGCIVLDPFVGSGTSAVEAELLGLDFIGVDTSPLCVKLSRVKTCAWESVETISTIVSSLLGKTGELGYADLMEIGASGIEGDFLDIARLVTASDIARRNRGMDQSLRRNLSRMLRSVRQMADAKQEFGLEFGTVRILQGDARTLNEAGIVDQSVDHIVTSPPYSIALDYVANDAAALEQMGVDSSQLRQGMIGVRGRGPKDRLALYNSDMKCALCEMSRVLKPGGQCVIVIGDATVDGKEKTTTGEIVSWAENAGLALEHNMPKIVFGLYSVVTFERILFFRKR